MSKLPAARLVNVRVRPRRWAPPYATPSARSPVAGACSCAHRTAWSWWRRPATRMEEVCARLVSLVERELGQQAPASSSVCGSRHPPSAPPVQQYAEHVLAARRRWSVLHEAPTEPDAAELSSIAVDQGTGRLPAGPTGHGARSCPGSRASSGSKRRLRRSNPFWGVDPPRRPRHGELGSDELEAGNAVMRPASRTPCGRSATISSRPRGRRPGAGSRRRSRLGRRHVLGDPGGAVGDRGAPERELQQACTSWSPATRSTPTSPTARAHGPSDELLAWRCARPRAS